MLAGELYRPDAELAAEHAAAKAWMARYNSAAELTAMEQHALLRVRLAHVGKDAVIRPPFFCDYGTNIRPRRRRLPQLQLRDPRRGRSDHRRPHPDRPRGTDLR